MKGQILKVLRQQNGSVSGQELCQCMGVSRTAVWKAIRQLQEAGYEIEAVQNKGYRLLAAPDVLTEPELVSRRRTEWLGTKFYCYDEVDSTNTQAKRLAEEGAGHGSVVVAEVQNAGRGRRGHQWSSQGGTGIWFSFILKPELMPAQAPMLTLVAAMAVVKALGRLPGIEPLIKWPNDVILNGRKVCGILTEMSAQVDYVNYIVTGIGINVKSQAFPKEVALVATTLETAWSNGNQKREDEEPLPVRSLLLETVLEEFERYYELYMQTKDVTLFLDEYHKYLANKDKQVKVLDPDGAYEGIARGINGNGELLVEREHTMVSVNSGEVSVRGIYGYAP